MATYKDSVSEISAWLSNQQEYNVVNNSLIVLEGKRVTTAMQKAVVCVNTVKISEREHQVCEAEVLDSPVITFI